MNIVMSPRKPYLIRAMYDWIVDNNLTPYILVNTKYPNVEVPEGHITNGRIVLNISPKASRGLHIANDRIVFTTSFSGNATQIHVPPGSVLAIYAKENREGLEFPEEQYEEPPPLDPTPKGKKKPSLKLVQ